MNRKLRLEDRALEDALATREQLRLCIEKDEEFFSGVRVGCIDDLLGSKHVELSKINEVNKMFICDLASDCKISWSEELRKPMGTPWKYETEWNKTTHILKLVYHVKRFFRKQFSFFNVFCRDHFTHFVKKYMYVFLVPPFCFFY